LPPTKQLTAETQAALDALMAEKRPEAPVIPPGQISYSVAAGEIRHVGNATPAGVAAILRSVADEIEPKE
jgi:hypothetical protein